MKKKLTLHDKIVGTIASVMVIALVIFAFYKIVYVAPQSEHVDVSSQNTIISESTNHLDSIIKEENLDKLVTK